MLSLGLYDNDLDNDCNKWVSNLTKNKSSLLLSEKKIKKKQTKWMEWNWIELKRAISLVMNIIVIAMVIK